MWLAWKEMVYATRGIRVRAEWIKVERCAAAVNDRTTAEMEGFVKVG